MAYRTSGGGEVKDYDAIWFSSTANRTGRVRESPARETRRPKLPKIGSVEAR